ncbi:unnamed protein product [Sphagnum balticum]
MFISSSAAAAAAGIHVIGCMRLRDVGVIQTFALFGSKPASKLTTTTAKVVKEKTVDGIFGTSGGIGFTKANELFVARVAMLGFAGVKSALGLNEKGRLHMCGVNQNEN